MSMSYSQFGEDVIVAELFAEIGEGDRHCMEVGAADGVKLSNTKMFRDEGWAALLLEQDEKQSLECQAQAVPDRVWVDRLLVTAERLNAALAAHNWPRSFDFASIDVDGQDYWLWEGLLYRPKVVCIEIADGKDDAPPPPVNPADVGAGPVQQAGFAAMNELAFNKGYNFHKRTRCNAIFFDALYDRGHI